MGETGSKEMDPKDMDDMPLLSRLLAQERHVPDLSEYGLYNTIYAYLQKEIPPLLAASSYAHKVELWQEIERIFDHMEFGLQWPDLLGRKMIGIMPLGKGKRVQACFQLLKEFVTPEVRHYLQLNQNVTSLLLPAPSFEGVRFLNSAWHIGSLNKREYCRATHELWRKNIEIGQFLECFAFGNAVTAFHHLAFTWLPIFRNRQMPLYGLLCEDLDSLLIVPPDDDEDWASSARFQQVLETCAQKGISVILAVDDPGQRAALQALPGCLLDMVTVLGREEVLPFLQQEDAPCCHYSYTVHLRKAFYDVEREAFNRQQESNENLLQIKNDLNFLSQIETREQVLQCRKDIQKELDQEEQALQKLRQALIGLFQQTMQLEVQLRERSGVDEMVLRLPDAFLMAQFVREYLGTGRVQEAKELSLVLQQGGFPDAYILPLLVQKQRGSQVAAEGLERLRHQGDNEFVRHAKIALLQELGFSEQDAMQIARDIQHLDTPAERYYRGVWAEHIKRYDTAAVFYEQAYRQGFRAASRGLMRLVQDVRFLPLARVADMMVPEACLLYGKELQREKYYAKADTYLKIAAGNGEMEAVRILARNLWWRLVHDAYGDDSKEAQAARLLNCRKLFEFLSGKYPEDEKIRETLGFIHLRRGDEQRALSVWMACHTAEARFQCGCLYEYDKGTFPQDLDKAAKFFLEARELGSKKAGAEYEKVQAWKRKKASQEKSSKTYRKTSNYSTRTKSTRSSDDDSCFITTAVCRALQKGDDCEELMAMRHFRDDARAADPLLQEMIGEYYRVAPAIIQRIQASEQADEVYEQLWIDDLCPVLRHLHRREYHQAALGYIAMVERLSHQYGVPFQSGIEEDIAAYRQRGAVPL
nr:CFI-box-CTERM domain-containing protein [Mitsuokella multacida]